MSLKKREPTHYRKRKSICERLRITNETFEVVTEFLLKTGLCVERNGEILPGPKNTFLESRSPLISRHHGNWRIKAMERHPTLRASEELSYSAPLSIATKDVPRVREVLAKAIEATDQIVDPSECERFFCLNMDWVEIL